MNIVVVLVSIVAISFIGVLLPVGLITFEEFSTPKLVTCPKDGKIAEIKADAANAALTSLRGASDLRLANCSRWPEMANCDRGCLRQI